MHHRMVVLLHHVKASKTLRDVYHPLFDKYDVDLVLAGHVHNYQRSFPIKYNDDKPSKPIITSSNKNNYNNPDGEIFAIVGTGGISFYSLDGKLSFMASQQAIRFGVLHLDITDKKLEASFHENDGSLRDQFSITKSASSSSSSALRASSDPSSFSSSSASMNPFALFN